LPAIPPDSFLKFLACKNKMADMDTTVDESSMAGGRRGAWLAHVKKTMRANKGKSLKQVLKLAKKTYKKKSAKKTRRGGGLSPMPLSGGRKH